MLIRICLESSLKFLSNTYWWLTVTRQGSEKPEPSTLRWAPVWEPGHLLRLPSDSTTSQSLWGVMFASPTLIWTFLEMEFSADSSFPINKLITDSSSLEATCMIAVLEGKVFCWAQEIVITFPTAVEEWQMRLRRRTLWARQPWHYLFLSSSGNNFGIWVSESLTLQG